MAETVAMGYLVPAMTRWLIIYLAVFIFGMAIRPQAGRGFSWLQGAIAGTLWCLYTIAGISAYRMYNHPNENITPLIIALSAILILRLTLYFWQKHVDEKDNAADEPDPAE